jgi:predicted secreted hydrolase
VALTGTAWLDRLWGDVPLPGGPVLRDRLVLHLSDGTDLSLCGRVGATGAASRRSTAWWWHRTERSHAWTIQR